MEQLKQFQKYQFWVLLGVALILPFVGWQMAVSGLAKETEDRTKALDSLFKSVTTSPNDPNDTWAKGVDEINKEQTAQKDVAWRALWERQQPLMVWPEKLPAEPEKINPGHQEYYRTEYAKFVEALRQKVNPFDEETGKGQVIYSEDLLPRPDLKEWTSAPSIPQIVAAQEDLWLLDSLLASIASVNAGADSLVNAPIREIEQLYLRGGTPKGQGGGAAKPAGGTAGGGTSLASMMKTPEMGNFGAAMRSQMDGMMGMMGGGGRGGSGLAVNTAKFNPDEDLGPERAAAQAKSATADTKSSNAKVGGMIAPTMMMPSMNMDAMGGGRGASGGQWSGFDKDRYRDDKKEWKTRGFYLEVTMVHRRVPELLTALNNGAWPVTILRVQVSDCQNEDLPKVGGGSAGGLMSPGLAGGGSLDAGGGGMPPMRRPGSAGMSMPGAGGASGRKPPRNARGADDNPGAGEVLGAGGGEAATIDFQSALEDPSLAHVAIVGVIYLIKPVEVKPGAPGAVPGGTSAPGAPAGTPGGAPVGGVATQPGTPGAGAPVAGTPAAGTPAATEAAKTEEAPGGEPAAETTTADEGQPEPAGESEKTDATPPDPGQPTADKPEPESAEPAPEQPKQK
ncbi:MAG: hypothetical protein JSS02_25075 [Planctomycetes bacterium]|nr:hypothetical protein [Planctomycetota bacterium]